MGRTLDLRVLLFCEDALWIAHCLEYDFCSSGRSIEDAQDNFRMQLMAEIGTNLERNKEPLEGIPPAPERFAHAFEKSAERLGRWGFELSSPFVFTDVSADRRISNADLRPG